MKNLRSFHGLPVILSTTGKKTGRVKSVLVNRELTLITGIVSAGRFGKCVFFPKENIDLMGKVAVIVSGEGCKKPRGEKFLPRRALDTAGVMIGAVTGLYADEERFFISHAELSYGVFEDIARGRKLVRRFTAKEETGEIVIHEKGEGDDEEGVDPRYDCGNDHGCVCSHDLRHDELAAGAQDGARCDECREGDLR